MLIVTAGPGLRLVGFVGALPLRLLAERTGLRAGLSAAMARREFDPVYDRGQVLIDMALTQILVGEAISDFQGLRHLAPVIGPVASTPISLLATDRRGTIFQSLTLGFVLGLTIGLVCAFAVGRPIGLAYGPPVAW